MEPVFIQDLARKLEIFWRMTPLGSRAALAEAFQMKESGIRYWEHGDASRDPGLVPAARYPQLLKLIAQHMPGRRTEAEVKKLLQGPLGPFREAFLANAEGNWEAFIAAHAQTDTLTVDLRSEGTSAKRGPAELDLPPPEELHRICPGDRFRLSFSPGFRTSAPYWVITLQFQEGVWEVLPASADCMIAEVKGRQVIMPDQTSAAGWYRINKTARDEIRFAMIAVTKPLPDELRSALSQGNVIEGARLDALAYHLSKGDMTDRMIALAKRFVPEEWTAIT